MVGRCALRVVVTSKDRAAVRLSLLSPLSCFLAPLAEAFLSLSAAPLILLMALAKDASSNRLRSVLDTRIYQTADCVAAMAKNIGQWDSLLFFLLLLSSFIDSFISDQMTFLVSAEDKSAAKCRGTRHSWLGEMGNTSDSSPYNGCRPLLAPSLFLPKKYLHCLAHTHSGALFWLVTIDTQPCSRSRSLKRTILYISFKQTRRDESDEFLSP